MEYFNINGFLILFIMLIPNGMFAKRNPEGFVNYVSSKALIVVENISRLFCFALMVFYVPRMTLGPWLKNSDVVFLSVNGVLLLIYIAGWVVLDSEMTVKRAVWLSVPPSLIFLFSGIMLLNIPLILFSLIFGFSHITVSVRNALIKQEMQVASLRPFEDSDSDIVLQWFKKPYITRWIKNPYDWMYELSHRNDEFSFVKAFIVLFGEKRIGYCQYYDYSKGGETWHNGIDISKTYSIDYLIGEEQFLRKHIGPQIVGLLEKEIIANTNAEKIIVRPEPENEISRKTLLASGYDYDLENDLFVKKLQ